MNTVSASTISGEFKISAHHQPILVTHVLIPASESRLINFYKINKTDLSAGFAIGSPVILPVLLVGKATKLGHWIFASTDLLSAVCLWVGMHQLNLMRASSFVNFIF